VRQITLFMPDAMQDEELINAIEGKTIQLISMCPAHNTGVLIINANSLVDAECSLQGLNCLGAEIVKKTFMLSLNPN